jgi:hypothetical protein
MLRPTARTILFSMPPGTIRQEAMRPPAGIPLRKPAPVIAPPSPPIALSASAIYRRRQEASQ